MMRRIINRILRRTPLFYAVRYVEPDGQPEIDIKDCMTCSRKLARWCERDGCTSITITPLLSKREVALAIKELEACEHRLVPSG